jgi:dTDP-4-amino-4,6-dideoxygalactose transaminase
VPETVLPVIPQNTTPVFHLFVVRVKNRDKVAKYLKDRGIDTGVHYPIALPNLKAYKYQGHSPEDFPVASTYQNEILSLPMFPELSDDQVVYVTTCLKEALTS